jgi:hypothetical protein
MYKNYSISYKRPYLAQDVNSTKADIMAVVQKPINTSILAENLALQLESNFRL